MQHLAVAHAVNRSSGVLGTFVCHIDNHTRVVVESYLLQTILLASRLLASLGVLIKSRKLTTLETTKEELGLIHSFFKAKSYEHVTLIFSDFWLVSNSKTRLHDCLPIYTPSYIPHRVSCCACTYRCYENAQASTKDSVCACEFLNVTTML